MIARWILHLGDRVVGNQDAALVALGQGFQPGRQVNRVTDGSSIHPIFAAHRSQSHLAGVDANANFDRHFARLLSFAVKDFQISPHFDRGGHRVIGRFRKQRHHRIANEFVNEAAILLNRRFHVGQIAVNESEALGR